MAAIGPLVSSTCLQIRQLKGYPSSIHAPATVHTDKSQYAIRTLWRARHTVAGRFGANEL